MKKEFKATFTNIKTGMQDEFIFTAETVKMGKKIAMTDHYNYAINFMRNSQPRVYFKNLLIYQIS